MSARQSILVSRRPSARVAFTLVELLVVIVIITVLIGALVTAGSVVVSRGKARNTQAVLTIVHDAVEQFKREQTAKPTVVNISNPTSGGRIVYQRRYGYYPPDELEVFTPLGLPGSNPPGGSMAPGGATVVPSPPPNYGAMQFLTHGIGGLPEYEHRDIAALVLAIELYSSRGSQILQRIPKSSWREGPVNAGIPLRFLDRPGGVAGQWDAEDLEIPYIVDAWGVPLSYFAQRDYGPIQATAAPVSSNHADWNRASTEMIRLNGGQPIIMSYGPDGEDQLSQTWMSGSGAASMVVDWAADGRINHHLNADNLYADPSLKEKLAQEPGT